MSGDDISPANRRYGLVLLVVLLVAASAVVAFRLLGPHFDTERFLTSFKNLHYGWLIAGITLVLFTYVGRAVRWRVMISPIRPNASLLRLLDATMIGFTAVTLFGRPGELVRPYLIATRERLPVSSQLAVWLLERIYDLLFVILVFGFCPYTSKAEIRHESRPGVDPEHRRILRCRYRHSLCNPSSGAERLHGTRNEKDPRCA